MTGYPLNHVLLIEAQTSNVATTGAAVDADSAPTFEVFEDTTDTDMGVGGSMTKRTSKTGDYRAQITLSAANGFEVGKMYEVSVTAIVGGVTYKDTAAIFRVTAAEGTTGVPPVDISRINNSSGAASNIQVAADTMITGAAATGTLTTTIFTTNLASTTTDAYKGRLIVFTSGALIRQAKSISAYSNTGQITVSLAFTTAPSNGDTFIIV